MGRSMPNAEGRPQLGGSSPSVPYEWRVFEPGEISARRCGSRPCAAKADVPTSGTRVHRFANALHVLVVDGRSTSPIGSHLRVRAFSDSLGASKDRLARSSHIDCVRCPIFRTRCYGRLSARSGQDAAVPIGLLSANRPHTG